MSSDAEKTISSLGGQFMVPGPLLGTVTWKQFLALLFAVLMVGSSVAYAAASII